MLQPIMRDIFFLSQKAEEATKKDLSVCADLEDTLSFHADHCVGMAANMIGINKRIIIFMEGSRQRCMLNPYIVKKLRSYSTEEGCLSLDGVRPCQRYEEIEVVYMDKKWHKQREKFTGFTAQIIQHEIDHCEGIVI